MCKYSFSIFCKASFQSPLILEAYTAPWLLMTGKLLSAISHPACAPAGRRLQQANAQANAAATAFGGGSATAIANAIASAGTDRGKQQANAQASASAFSSGEAPSKCFAERL